MKEARLTWSKAEEKWIIKVWSERKEEWIEDTSFPVKDVETETEQGWVSEMLILRLYDLQDQGYKIGLF